MPNSTFYDRASTGDRLDKKLESVPSQLNLNLSVSFDLASVSPMFLSFIFILYRIRLKLGLVHLWIVVSILPIVAHGIIFLPFSGFFLLSTVPNFNLFPLIYK